MVHLAIARTVRLRIAVDDLAEFQMLNRLAEESSGHTIGDDVY